MIAFAALLFSALSMPLSAQNGITGAEAGAITPANSTDALWADGGDHRWKMAVTSSSALGSVTFSGDVAIWPCGMSLGGIPYATSAPFTGADDMEMCLGLPSPVVNGVPLLVGTSAPQWGAENLDIQGNALVVEVAASSSAPSASYLVTFTVTSGNTTVTAAGTAQNGIEGICAGNCTGRM